MVETTNIKIEPEDNQNTENDEQPSDRQPSPDYVPLTSNKRKRAKKEKLAAVSAKRPKNDVAVLPNTQATIANIQQQQQEDAVDIFFKSIAMTVKNLPQRAINVAKIQILTLVNQLEENYATPSQLE